MTFLKQDVVERMRRQYPPNTKIKCIHMSVDRHPVPDGTLGTVQFVDDAGTIHVGWENGSSLGLVHGEYQFTKVKKREYER